MITKKNFKKKILNRKLLIGAWFQILKSDAVEIVSKNNFDWVCFDFEHGIYTSNDLPDLLRATKLNKKFSFVRTLSKDISEIRKIFDLGADGVIVPKIETADEVKNIYQNIFYPPKGSRGIGYCRANMYGKFFSEYIKKSQNNLFIIMIESLNGVKNLEDILKQKLADGIFVGPYDLSASLNDVGNFKSKKFNDCLNRILFLSKKYNVSCGLHILEKNSKSIYKEKLKGFNFNAYLTDSIIISDYKI